MKLFLFSAVCFILSFSTGFASDRIVQERLKEAKSGDYIVVEANKMVSLIAIRSKTPETLLLEEISLPANMQKPSSWGEWVQKRAPGHTSWSMVEIDLSSHKILECFSFSRSSWIQVSQKESLLATLLSLPLKPVDTSLRRRIGPAPLDGEADRRRIWNPPLVYEGQKEQAEFIVFHGAWPQDNSPMAGNEVTLYFDKAHKLPFPAWIQVETDHLAGSLRVIDSGKGLPSLHHSIPRRVPEFVGTAEKTKSGLRLNVKSPAYYRSFELYAVDITSREKEICPIMHSLKADEEELVQIEIDETELKSALKQDHRYTWLIVPAGHSESYTESSKSFTWKSTN